MPERTIDHGVRTLNRSRDRDKRRRERPGPGQECGIFRFVFHSQRAGGHFVRHILERILSEMVGPVKYFCSRSDLM